MPCWRWGLTYPRLHFLCSLQTSLERNLASLAFADLLQGQDEEYAQRGQGSVDVFLCVQLFVERSTLGNPAGLFLE